VTATVGWHLLEVAEKLGDERARHLGEAAATFLAERLNLSRLGNAAALSYTQYDHTRVVNISALAARVIARADGDPGSGARGPLARCLIEFVLQEQRGDGSWPYSADEGGDWEDSFHTGYVLEALINLFVQGASIPEGCIVRGLTAYQRFFDSEGAARLFDSPASWFDAHSAAQGIITLAAVGSAPHLPAATREGALASVHRVASWARRALWLPDAGYFAYRVRGNRRIKHDYIRWVQAWMALAMATDAAMEGTGSASNASEDEVVVA
jgi:hypothetical protein